MRLVEVTSLIVTASLVLYDATLPVVAAITDAEHGRVLAHACLGCHGNADLLQASPGLFVPRIARQSARYLFDTLESYKYGRRNDPIMRAQLAALNRHDLRDLAAYFSDEHPNQDVAAIRSLGPGGDDQLIPRKVVEICGSCHGETGGGVLPEIPSLAGQYPNYLRQALQQYRNGKRSSAVMSPLAHELTAVEIIELATYFSIQTTRPFSVADSVPAPSADYGTAQTEGFTPAVDITYDQAKPVRQVISEIEMAEIPTGTFWMGDDVSKGFAVGSPRHQVHIGGFRIQKTETTFEQFDAFARDTRRALPDDEGWGRGLRPVVNVTWTDTQQFITWLNRKSHRHFRLPSESEWEYAARGGTATVYWWGDDFKPDYLNARGTNARDKWLYTAPVGQFPANPYGLFDTSGNVAERVADCWHSGYSGAPADGSAWLSSPCYSRVSRGGSWNLAIRPMRSSARSGTADSIASMALGFRLAEDRP